jgi:tight adherence protein B
MDLSAIAPILLAAVAAGGVAYVFIYPFLSGEARAEKRQAALIATPGDRRAEKVAAATASRREQVTASLKEIEAREKTRNKLTLDMRLTQAGLAWSKSRFYMVSALIGLGLALVLLMVTRNPLVALAGGFIGLLGAPRWLLSYLRKRRVKRFIDELPNALDVVVRGIRAGLPLADCIRMIANEAREPLRSEFKTLVEAQAVGLSIADACSKLYDRVPVAEANFFAIVIQIQSKSGGNLSEAIGNLSRVLRERKKMAGKIAAMSMEAKASAAIIACLPFVVAILTYISSPKYIELLWTTQTGKFVMVASGLWMLTGILVMKKMISFKI